MSDGSLRVLLVDDDETALDALSRLLSCAGFELVSLASPIGSTRVAIEREVDVIVLDLHMSAFSGDRLAMVLRKSRQLADVPIIVVSSANSRQDGALIKRASGVVTLPEARVRSSIVQLIAELAASGPRKSAAESMINAIEHHAPANHGSALSTARASGTSQLALPREARDMVPCLLRLSKLWRDASTGSLAAQRAFAALLSDLSAEYADTRSPMFEDICRAMEGALRTLKPGTHASPSLSGAVLAGVNLMVRLSRTTPYERPDDVAAVLWRLATEMNKALERPLRSDARPVPVARDRDSPRALTALPRAS